MRHQKIMHRNDVAYVKRLRKNTIYNYDFLIEECHKLGYKSFVGAINGIYRKTKSIRKSASLLKVSEQYFRRVMRELGIAANGPGGDNRTAEYVKGDQCPRCGGTIYYKSRPTHCRSCNLAAQQRYLKRMANR